MKQHIHHLFAQAFAIVQSKGIISTDISVDYRVERTKDAQHGDFACNIAMLLAKPARMSPRQLAEQIVTHLPTSPLIIKVEIAGPGFINLFLAPHAYHTVITDILAKKELYGTSQIGMEKSVIIEFVSANPTGPLHVGHGRGAAYGSALANLLIAAGFHVFREYYVNDAGRQMDILATSVWLRYLELCGETVRFPENGYQGDYIWDIAASLHREHKDALRYTAIQVYDQIPPDNEQGGDKEKHIDALIQRTKQLLGEVSYRHVFREGVDSILSDIHQDLQQFGVEYDQWFRESTLTTNQTVQRVIDQLNQTGHTYQQEGALWFRSSQFGDEKDRVLVRENGQFTYFASDIAYHLNKLERGSAHLINIWGADHHGYIARVKAAITALGENAERLTVLLVQFATLYRGQERLQMSTRSGKFVTLRELREEVGRDAARFFYTQRKSEQHLDFDLELAKSQSIDNPVYYIQYAHARIASVFRQLSDRQQQWIPAQADFSCLTTEHETALLVTLSRYPEIVENAALTYAPHQITHYLQELAQDFHTYYNAHTFLVEEDTLRHARLSLIAAVQQVLRNGLKILGISAPEVM